MRELALIVIGLGCSAPASSTPPNKVEPTGWAPAREATSPAQRQQAIEDAVAAGVASPLHSEASVTGHGDVSTPILEATVTVTIGDVTVQGDADKAIIRRYIRQSLPKIRFCYERELASNPALAGTVNVNFVIEPDGKVGSAKGTGLPPVDACVAAVIRDIQFPAPKSGGQVQVNYPFVFRP